MSKIKKIGGFILITTLISTALAVFTDKRFFDDNTPNIDRISCPMVYKPVCTFKGRTYSNKCVAEKEKNATIKHYGECTEEEDWDPDIDHNYHDATKRLTGLSKEKRVEMDLLVNFNDFFLIMQNLMNLFGIEKMF